MTRVPLLIALSLLITVAASADELKQAPPDYSRETILRITRDLVVVETPKKVSFEKVGEVRIRMPWALLRFLYLPVPPLPGSVPRATTEWPNPFTLTHTDLAMTAQQWARH